MILQHLLIWKLNYRATLWLNFKRFEKSEVGEKKREIHRSQELNFYLQCMRAMKLMIYPSPPLLLIAISNKKCNKFNGFPSSFSLCCYCDKNQFKSDFQCNFSSCKKKKKKIFLLYYYYWMKCYYLNDEWDRKWKMKKEKMEMKMRFW